MEPPRPNSNTPWYVIHTKPKHEDVVAGQLARIQIDIFNPKIWGFVRTRSGSQSPSIRPLFPGYIFTRSDLKNAWLHRLIRYTRGVSKVLADGHDPVPLGHEVIEEIRTRMGPDGIIKPSLTLKKGDPIRVRSSFLKDLIGILERPTSDGERVVVLLTLLQKQVRVTLPTAHIEKIS